MIALPGSLILACHLFACASSPKVADLPEPTPSVGLPTAVSIPRDESAEFLNLVPNEVNGIRIGSSYEELIERFGKPHSVKKGGQNPCSSAKTVLLYDGIKFTMDDDGEQNIVVAIEITSQTWEIAPGIRTGYTIEDVRSRMGRKRIVSIEEGMESVGYADGDGYLRFFLENGKVTRIIRELNMC